MRLTVRSTLRLGVALLAAVVCFVYGISIYNRPEFETSYQAARRFRSCHEERCLHYFTVTIGNTGWHAQEDLIVTINPEPEGVVAIPVRVRNSGKVNRTVDRIVGARSEQLHIGVMEPGQVVEISWALQLPATDNDPKWSDVISSIEPAKGALREAPPQGVAFMRLWAKMLS